MVARACSMTTIKDIEEILERAGSPEVENLRVIRAGEGLEVHGSAKTVSARLSAFQLIEEALGVDHGVTNMIELVEGMDGMEGYGVPSTANDILDDGEE